MPCKFCKAEKTVDAKGICRECLQKCAVCSVEDDGEKCPRTYRRITCGAMLEAGCYICGRDKDGSRYCGRCADVVKYEKDRARAADAYLTNGNLNSPVLTLGECSKLLGVSIHRIRYLYESGKLVDVPRVAQKRVFTVHEILKLKRILLNDNV